VHMGERHVNHSLVCRGIGETLQQGRNVSCLEYKAITDEPVNDDMLRGTTTEIFEQTYMDRRGQRDGVELYSGPTRPNPTQPDLWTVRSG